MFVCISSICLCEILRCSSICMCEILCAIIAYLIDTSLLFTAPGPVQSLTVSFLSDSATYNSSTVTYNLLVSISWQPPQYPNGEIITYNYRLVETIEDETIVIDANTTDTSVQRSVTVSPFTNYSATVVAFTSVGGGDSVMEIALSPEAGKFI